MSEALNDLAAYIREKLDGQIGDAVVAYGELTLSVEPADIVNVMNFLRRDVQCQFVSIIDICGADYPARPKRFDVVYHLLSPRLSAQPQCGHPVPSDSRPLLSQRSIVPVRLIFFCRSITP